MIIRSVRLVAFIVGVSSHVAMAQSTVAPPPSGQTMQGMGNMPGMSGGSPADMASLMKQCEEMKAQMKAGMKMTPDMRPMMDRCDKMGRGMGATKAPDETLSR